MKDRKKHLTFDKDIPFDPTNVAYLFEWYKSFGRKPNGYSLIRNLESMVPTSSAWLVLANERMLYDLTSGTKGPYIYQFDKTLDAFFEGEIQKKVNLESELPKLRELNGSELHLVYQQSKYKIADLHPPYFQAKVFLPMFF